ncbi:hypothetical protein GQ457_04G019910 [Hibiscus cannabinus]
MEEATSRIKASAASSTTSPSPVDWAISSRLRRGGTWIASHEEKQLHFKECMIQGLCENSMVRLPETGSRQINFCILEVHENFQKRPARKRFSRRLKDHLRRLEARFVKQLKRLRHYDLNIGNFQVK